MSANAGGKKIKPISNATNLSIDKFEVVKAIGRGGFGKVFIVQKDGKQYAMKEMYKARVMNKNSIESVMDELAFLRKIDKTNPMSNFLVNVHYAFHDFENLYICLDLLNGGDFRYHLLREKAFQPDVTKFFIASIALGLEACHK